MIVDAALVAEALEEIKPYDTNGQMKQRIDALMKRRIDVPDRMDDRGELALVIAGEDRDANLILANAYAKALQGHGLVEGSGGGRIVTATVNWPSDVQDVGMSRQMMEQSFAASTVKGAKESARGGTLIVSNFDKKAYENWTDEAEAAPLAEKGGISALTSAIKGGKDEGMPVVVITGAPEGLKALFNRQAEFGALFAGKLIDLSAPPVVEAEISTALGSSITVRAPLKLKLPAATR